MRGEPSFHEINYALRTNKSIERKIVFEKLAALQTTLQFHDYRYVGFGSMWFVDFVLAHRMLGIHEMWSIEKKVSAARAEYNRPYDCIQVKPGECSEVLKNMSDADWLTEMLAWLDYDGPVDSDVLDDLETLMRKTPSGSVVIVTANATRSNYRTGEEDKPKRVLDSVKELFGSAVPTEPLSGNQKDIQASEFPAFLGTCLLGYLGRAVQTSGRSTGGFQDRFIPLFFLTHLDQAHMCTVGGIIASWRQVAELEGILSQPVELLAKGSAIIKDDLDLIPITPKEKFTLDRMLPCEEHSFNKRAVSEGIELSAEVVEKYRRLYRHFPVFLEAIF